MALHRALYPLRSQATAIVDGGTAPPSAEVPIASTLKLATTKGSQQPTWLSGNPSNLWAPIDA